MIVSIVIFLLSKKQSKQKIAPLPNSEI